MTVPSGTNGATNRATATSASGGRSAAENRRAVLGRGVRAALALAATTAPFGATKAAAAPGATPTDTAFRAFVEDLWAEAQRNGVSRGAFDAAFAGVTPDASVAAMTERQPELVKPIGAYLAAQVTGSRVVEARSMLARWSKDLAAIERRYGIPRAILVAVWGLESNFGTAAGSKDVIRSMATLAAMGYRPELYRAELIAALAMLERHDVDRAALSGSWAGAMGYPQFMPSSYQHFAVDWDGDGRRDIWTDVPDSLASIGNFLQSKGWDTGRPWGFEVRLPPGFDLAMSRASFGDWTALGFSRTDGKAMPTTGLAILFFPAGLAGPAFLVSQNFEVLKTYNFSDAYVLGVAELADRSEGAPAIKAPWPTEPPLSRADRIALQARMAGLGYAVDNREGRISLALRDVIRLAQARVGLPADGNPTRTLLLRLD